MKLQTGDRILTRRVKGPFKLFSTGIAWRLCSSYSHIIPVLNEHECLNIVFPKPKIIHPQHFLTGEYDYKILRPVAKIDTGRYLDMAARVNRQNYDIKSFLGFILNRGDIQDKARVNCSEGMLLMDWAAGLLQNIDGRLISPKSYEDFADAGLFTIAGVK